MKKYEYGLAVKNDKNYSNGISAMVTENNKLYDSMRIMTSLHIYIYIFPYLHTENVPEACTLGCD